MRHRRLAVAAACAASAALSSPTVARGRPASTPPAIRIAELGHLVVGGAPKSVRGAATRARVRAPGLAPQQLDPNGDFVPGATYVRFIRLQAPHHRLPILLLPGGGLSGAVYETTPDGRPGWESFFLRAGYSVFTADLEQTGRSPWARYPEIDPEEPAFRDRAFLWEVFRVGPPGSYGEGLRAFPGTQFPVAAFDAFGKLAAPRFRPAPEVEAATFDTLVERVCPCVLLAHSASGGPALAVAQRRADLVKAVVAVEPSTVPEGGPRQAPPTLLVWGDFLGPDQTQASWAEEVTASRRFAQATPGSAGTTLLDLPALGIRGNSHMLMSDLNSDRVAGLIDDWIRARGF